MQTSCVAFADDSLTMITAAPGLRRVCPGRSPGHLRSGKMLPVANLIDRMLGVFDLIEFSPRRRTARDRSHHPLWLALVLFIDETPHDSPAHTLLTSDFRGIVTGAMVFENLSLLLRTKLAADSNVFTEISASQP